MIPLKTPEFRQGRCPVSRLPEALNPGRQGLIGKTEDPAERWSGENPEIDLRGSGSPWDEGRRGWNRGPLRGPGNSGFIHRQGQGRYVQKIVPIPDALAG
jgi:hypothetical protein